MASVQGIDDFNAALTALTKDLRKRVIRSALRAAARPIIKAAQSIAKVKTGLMKKRVVATASRLNNGRNGTLGIFIKPKKTKSATKGGKADPYYYKFIAGGFHAVGTRRVAGGKLTRKANLRSQVKAGKIRFISGDDFLGKAFRMGSGQALSVFQNKLKERIDAANRRK